MIATIGNPAFIGRDADAARFVDAPGMRVSFADASGPDAAVVAAAEILRREGVVVLDDLVDPALLEACREEIVELYPDYDLPNRERFLGSYPGRHTMPLVIDGTLANRAIFAPKPLMRLGKALLGPERILEAFGLLVSIPGAPDQGRHFDGLLYEETNLDSILPPFALSIAMPLVPLDEVSGTTAFWRGSHRTSSDEATPDFAPHVPVGSAIVWDFRTHHSGRANLSGQPRPVLFCVHARNWWVEPYRAWAHRYRKLQVRRAVHDAFGEPMRHFTVRADIID